MAEGVTSSSACLSWVTGRGKGQVRGPPASVCTAPGIRTRDLSLQSAGSGVWT